MSVLQTLFNFRSGELERIPYLLYSFVSLATMWVSGTLFIGFLHEGGVFTIILGLLFALATYVTFSLVVKRVRHIGLTYPIGLVLSFFVLIAFFLLVMPVSAVSQGGQQLGGSEFGGVQQVIMYAVFLLWGVPGSFLDKKPFRVLFCDAMTGQLRRVPFFGYIFFLAGFFPFVMYLILMPFQALLAYSSASIVVFLAVVVFALSLFAYGGIILYSNAVLTIKRMRNIGFKRPVLYFWLYMAFVFITLGAMAVYVVTTVDFAAVQATHELGPLMPIFVIGVIYYLIFLGIGLFLFFAPEGTLNSQKKLEK